MPDLSRTSSVSNVSKSQNEPSISDLVNAFFTENPGTGSVVFEVHNDDPVRGRVPVPNAQVTVSKLLGNDYYLSKIETTNENGETDPVRLPTVSRNLSLRPGETRVFSSYRASVEAPGFQRQDFYDIQIFDGITTIQHVNLHPATAGAPARPTTPPTAPTTPARPPTPPTPARPTGPAASKYEKRG